MDVRGSSGSSGRSSNSAGGSGGSGGGRDRRVRSLPTPLWSSFVDVFIDSLQAKSALGATPPAGAAAHSPAPPVTYLPAAKRLIAIGDVHGDLGKTQAAFQMAGLTDAAGRWCGGETVAVQVGDQLDRGGEEIPILYFLERLKREAEKSGGAVHVLNGNHETMNVMGVYRYANEEGVEDFQRWHALQRLGERMKRRCGEGPGLRAAPPLRHCPPGLHPALCPRFLATRPGGPITTRFLAGNPTVLQVGSSVFVHGGVMPHHIEYGLSRINAENHAWMMGRLPGGAEVTYGGEARRELPPFVLGSQAIVWSRSYSERDPSRCRCDVLREVLAQIPGGERMIMGHTIQKAEAGINSTCQGQALRVDVGMSAGCSDNKPEVLEILNDKTVQRLVEDAAGTVKRVPVQEAKPKANPVQAH